MADTVAHPDDAAEESPDWMAKLGISAGAPAADTLDILERLIAPPVEECDDPPHWTALRAVADDRAGGWLRRDYRATGGHLAAPKTLARGWRCSGWLKASGDEDGTMVTDFSVEAKRKRRAARAAKRERERAAEAEAAASKTARWQDQWQLEPREIAAPLRRQQLIRRTLGAPAAWHDFMYLLGGRDRAGTPIAHCERLRPGHSSFQAIAPMATARALHCAAAIRETAATAGEGDSVYGFQLLALGGVDRYANGLSSCEEYDSAMDCWSPMADLPERTYAASAGTLVGSGNATVYCTGGIRGAAVASGSTVAYDQASGAWRSAPSLRTGRSHAGAGVVRNALIVAGGRGRGAKALDTVELLDERSGRWTPRSPLPEARDWPVASAVGDSLFRVGGGYGNAAGLSDSVFLYDLRADRWSREEATLPYLCKGATAAPFDGTWCLAGGAHQDGRMCLEVWNSKPNHEEAGWSNLPAPRVKRSHHVAVSVPCHDMSMVRIANQDTDAVAGDWRAAEKLRTSVLGIFEEDDPWNCRQEVPR